MTLSKLKLQGIYLMGDLNHLKIIQLVEIHRIWEAAREKEVLGSLMDKETLIITIQRLLSSKI